MQRYLVHIDTESPTTFNISVLEALYIMKKAWNDVSATVVENCFCHAGFSLEQEILEAESEITRGVAEEDKDLGSLFGRLKDVVTVEATLDAFISVDDDVPTTEETSIQQIAADLRDGESDDEAEEETVPTTSAEARSALLTLKKFINEQGTDDLRNAIWSLEFKFEDHIVRRAKQTVIIDHLRASQPFKNAKYLLSFPYPNLQKKNWGLRGGGGAGTNSKKTVGNSHLSYFPNKGGKRLYFVPVLIQS